MKKILVILMALMVLSALGSSASASSIGREIPFFIGGPNHQVVMIIDGQGNLYYDGLICEYGDYTLDVGEHKASSLFTYGSSDNHFPIMVTSKHLFVREFRHFIGSGLSLKDERDPILIDQSDPHETVVQLSPYLPPIVGNKDQFFFIHNQKGEVVAFFVDSGFFYIKGQVISMKNFELEEKVKGRNGSDYEIKELQLMLTEDISLSRSRNGSDYEIKELQLMLTESTSLARIDFNVSKVFNDISKSVTQVFEDTQHELDKEKENATNTLGEWGEDLENATNGFIDFINELGKGGEYVVVGVKRGVESNFQYLFEGNNSRLDTEPANIAIVDNTFDEAEELYEHWETELEALLSEDLSLSRIVEELKRKVYQCD